MLSRKPIAVGPNDSAQSQAAVLWAARRAEEANVPLVILHVVDDRWVAEPYPWIGVLEESGEKLLEVAADRVRGAFPIAITTRLLTGSVGGSLAKYSGKASMVVVGSGTGHLGGSLADRALQVAASAKVPVAVVGTQDLEGHSGVVVGVDGSKEATEAVAFAAAEADRAGEELTVLYAIYAPDPVVDSGLTPATLSELIEFGNAEHERKIHDFGALGSAPWSVIDRHNLFMHQVRDSFAFGAYYPALVGACALGERLLNELVIRLRNAYSEHPATTRVANTTLKPSASGLEMCLIGYTHALAQIHRHTPALSVVQPPAPDPSKAGA